MSILSPNSHMECDNHMLKRLAFSIKSLPLFSTLLLLGAFLAGQGSVEAATHYVKLGGTGAGDSWANAGGVIQAVITSATAGDEIWVASGTYVESVTMTTSLALYGGFAGTETSKDQRNWEANPTILDASDTFYVVLVYGMNGTLVDGFTITANDAPYSPTGVIFQNVDSATLSHCTVTGVGGGGVGCESASPTLSHCLITGNTNRIGGCGIDCIDGSSPTVINCTITGNSTERIGGGLHFDVTSSATLTNCILWNQGVEVYSISEDLPVITHSCVRRGYSGVGNIDTDPLFVDLVNGDYHLQDGSPCIDAGIDKGFPYNGSAPDMGAWESPASYQPDSPRAPIVWYVDGQAAPGGDGRSWASAFQTLSAGPLWWAVAGDEIWVASGTYQEAIDIEVPGLALYGGFAGTETARGQRDWTANPTSIDASGLNSRVVTVNRCEDTTLDGFIITGGRDYIIGGGILYEWVLSATLSNCTIEFNTATYGAGVLCSHSSPTLNHCMITRNTATERGCGIACVFSSTPTVTNCTIAGNSNERSSGCLFFDSDTSATLTNCIMWNPGEEVISLSGKLPNITYTCVQGGFAGTGNTGGDPLFVDLVNGDYHLQDGSPCIDAGIDKGFPYLGSAPDMGAREAPASYTQGEPREPRIWYVNAAAADGGDGHSWATALNAVSGQSWGGIAGDEIWVASGTYFESLILSGSTSLYGGFMGTETSRDQRDWVSNLTTIDATDLIQSVITIKEVDNVIVDGFTLTGGYTFTDGGGIYCSQVHSSTFAHCTITGNYTMGSGGGVFFGNSHSPALITCTITGNMSNNDGGGVYCDTSSPILTSCTITANSAYYNGGGIYCATSPLTLSRCWIMENSANNGAGLCCYDATATITDSSFTMNIALNEGGGIYCAPAAPVLSNCTFTANYATNNGGGLYCSNSSVLMLTNCVVAGNIVESHGGGIFCVTSTATLTGCQLFMNSAWDGGGIYYHDSISTVTGCFLFFNEAYNDGAGVFCDAATAHLSNSMIAINAAYNNGGGVFYSGVSSPRLTDCVLGGNSAYVNGGAVYCVTSTPMLNSCEFAMNNAGQYGGGVCCYAASPVLNGCTITDSYADNSGGGLFCTRLSAPVLNGCTITANYAKWDGGGTCFDESTPVLTRCLIANNSSLYGSAGAWFFSTPVLTHCTIAANQSDPLWGSLENVQGYPTLTNCILWNPGLEYENWVPDVTMTHCCVQGGFPGTGNINADPLFVDLAGGDYHLSNGSPCIDAGTDTGLPYKGIAPDMGVWEAPASYTQGEPRDPRIWYVNVSAPAGGDGRSWATAVNSISYPSWSCVPGDEIWAASGTYPECVSLADGLSLYGGFVGTETSRDQRDWIANPTIIDASGLSQRVISIRNAGSVLVDGFTITGGNTGENGGGILCESVVSATFTHCTIVGNTAVNGGGMFCYYSSPVVTDCTFTANTATQGGGMYNMTGAAVLANCRITGNTGFDYSGGVTCDSSMDTFTNCTITRNSGGYDAGGLDCINSATPTLTNCILWNRGSEISLFSSVVPTVSHCCVQGGYAGEGNINANPLFENPDENNWRLRNGSPCIDSGTQVTGLTYNGTAPDMGAWESPASYIQGVTKHTPLHLYVNISAATSGNGLSWATAMRSLNVALSICSVSDEIWVAKGVYPEAIQMEQGASFYGGFTGVETERDQRDWMVNPTILDATGWNSYVVTVGSTERTTLDGFTFTGGSGGVYYTTVHSATLTQSIITGNMSSDEGGGVYGWNCSPTLVDCTITGNTAAENGGGMCWDTAAPMLTDCTIANNTASSNGGGMYGKDSTPVLTDCTITSNTASSEGGGVLCDSSAATLTGCMITGNTTIGYAGGVSIYSTSIHLTNCTIAGNTSILAGGVYSDESSLSLINCILWNRGSEVYTFQSETPTFTHCCVQGGFTGEGNIDAYPLFENPDGNDWRLRDGSPCVNGGILLTKGTFNGTAPDMGAWESPAAYTQGVTTHTPLHLYVDASAAMGGDGLSWATAFRTHNEALWISSVSDEIWTAKGTYREVLFPDQGATLYGGFEGNETDRGQRDWMANPTILDASGLTEACVATLAGGEKITLDGFSFIHGSNGGVACLSVDSATLNHCIITGNTTYDGGGLYCESSSPMVNNCLIAGNTVTGNGGGVCCDQASPMLTNCTIASNTAESGDGVYCYPGSLPTFTNCILWNPADEFVVDSATPTVTFSCVKGGYAGVENISEDPLFTDATYGDYTLQSTSLCIDAGNPDAVFNDGCLPPGQGTVRNDMGYTGGPGNCGQTEPVIPTPTPTMTPLEPTPTPTQPPVPTPDINGDGKVTVKDLLLFKAAWGQTTGGDFNSDGVTDQQDLWYFSRYWYE